MKTLFILIILFLSSSLFASGDDHHDGGEKFGHGKAIEAVTEEGFKLSKEAFQTLGVKLKKVDDNKNLGRDVLVVQEDKVGVYRYRQGFFKFIRVPEIEAGDEIVTAPLGLIRVSDIFSTDSAEYGHGH